MNHPPGTGLAGGSPWRIAIIPFTGGPVVRMLDVPQSLANGHSVIHWTDDGNGILFIRLNSNVASLMLQTLNLASPKGITSFTKEQFYSFDFSRDGRLVLSRGFRTNDVVVISGAR